ncbi:MAG TPA: ankyrin repeat domain-containing protein [Sphingopyxis sp.]|nr:ankyrin repeat domain-containing protein [Sphingopyxis sp.]HMP44098.1 ankyrin repeat domain-containing protein [Sphingopyxis sp.]HMQ19114.1 ankyrin repeat domain-containing protein [Sphingopyxis sp.]
MNSDQLLDLIARGRTDLILDLLDRPDGPVLAASGRVSPLQWLVYYGDVTGLRAALRAGCDFGTLDLGRELGNAAFSGLWKTADFLIEQGADPDWREPGTGETVLHGALSKAGRPHYAMVVRLLLERGANPNVPTLPGKETGAFMRDIRTCGEYPLHRAAAYADAATIRLLLDAGADRECRDAHGDTPLCWASRHLRPGAILRLLAYGDHHISDRHVALLTSDHGAGWGEAMERNILGDYLPLSTTAPQGPENLN